MLERSLNDLAVKQQANTSPVDIRVPTADEFALDSEITAHYIRSSRLDLGFMSPPALSIQAGGILSLSGQALIPVYPGITSIETQLQIPALSSAAATILRKDNLYLVGFAAEVGAEQDDQLGTFSFQYRSPSASIETLQKENTRRYRAFWVLVYGENELTLENFVGLLTLEQTGDRRLTFANTTTAGFVRGGYRIYALDSNLKSGSTYIILSDLVDILRVCQIRRIQNFPTRGYTWGGGGEETLENDFNLLDASKIVSVSGIGNLAREAIFRIFSGKVGKGFGYTRSVQNLAAGPVAGNPGRSGESAGSPNGSVCLANDQRVSFSNEERRQSYSVQILSTVNNGSGSAIVTAILNSNSPAGSRFSERRGDHKIYTASGSEESALGNFTITSNSLTWTAGPNSTITPGAQIYFVPSVIYPAGSGFSIAFSSVERAWVGIQGQSLSEISSQNIRVGYSSDIDNYQDPAEGGSYFVVVGPERAALHYILRKISITTDSVGVALIPGTARGCFAFVQGRSGRIDAPIVKDLAPNTTYNALIYHPPRSTESWQLQLKYSEYQGLGNGHVDFLEGAEVAAEPFLYVHSQGGGCSVYGGESTFRFSPISMHLPAMSLGVQSYSLNMPMQSYGDPYGGPDSFIPSPVNPAPGLALPKVGQRITYETRVGSNSRSMSVAVQFDGLIGGFKSPRMNKDEPFQSVLGIPLRKGNTYRLLLATHNGIGAKSISLDTSLLTAIDLFTI